MQRNIFYFLFTIILVPCLVNLANADEEPVPEPGQINFQPPPEPNQKELKEKEIPVPRDDDPPEPGKLDLNKRAGRKEDGPPEPGNLDFNKKEDRKDAPPEPGKKDLGAALDTMQGDDPNPGYPNRVGPVLPPHQPFTGPGESNSRATGAFDPRNSPGFDPRKIVVVPDYDKENERRRDPFDRRRDPIIPPEGTFDPRNSPGFDPRKIVIVPDYDKENERRRDPFDRRTDPIIPPEGTFDPRNNPGFDPNLKVPVPNYDRGQQRWDRNRPHWECDMNYNQCRLENRVNFVPFQKGSYQGQAALVLDVGEASRERNSLARLNPVKSYNAARLVTRDYFPAGQNRIACLHFSFAWDGYDNSKRMHILQRNRDDKCIYSSHTNGQGGTDRGQWQDLELQLDLSGGDSAFLLEFSFDTPPMNNPSEYSRLGKIAIRDFKIGYGYCHRNQAIECDLPIR